MIISDPKMELYRSAKSTLEKRGYVVKLLNLVDPLASMGYNPLQLVIDYYKAGYIEKAQLAARAFAFSVFAADNSTQEPIWKNTATDLFTALIVAVTTDCLEADRTLNEERRKAWVEKREAFNQLEPDLKIVAIQKFKEMQALSEDVLLNEYVSYIPDTIPFTEVYPNEKNISCFSCLNFFRELCDRKAGALSEARDDNEREQILETALDEYFSQRPPLDYAKALYQETKRQEVRQREACISICSQLFPSLHWTTLPDLPQPTMWILKNLVMGKSRLQSLLGYHQMINPITSW